MASFFQVVNGVGGTESTCAHNAKKWLICYHGTQRQESSQRDEKKPSSTAPARVKCSGCPLAMFINTNEGHDEGKPEGSQQCSNGCNTDWSPVIANNYLIKLHTPPGLSTGAWWQLLQTYKCTQPKLELYSGGNGNCSKSNTTKHNLAIL